jgi:GNAT superfamily N-acetyltransferase
VSDESTLRRELAAAIPDAPRTIEMRALLALAATTCAGTADGAVIANEARRVVALVGDPDDALVEDTLARMGTSATVLSLHRTRGRAGGLAWKRATVMTLAHPERLAERAREARPHVVPLDLSHLAHVPVALGEELASALGAGPVTCALTSDGEPASFAYAPFETERLFDVSVDTLAEHRGHGHATRAAAVLVDLVRATGRAPVWAAADENRASLAVAKKLGFAPLSHLFVAETHGPSGV